MIYRQYGKTGKKVSALGMGCARLGAGQDMEEEVKLVLKAFESGINYFDTAPDYCGGKSEEILGIAFGQLAKETFYVATKSHVSADPKADDVRRRIDLSLKKLNVPKINFYHMWAILDIDQYKRIMQKGGPYEGALAAKSEGLIDHVCFSTHCSGDEIEKIINDDVFEGVILGYNAINFKYREKGLNAAQKKGLGVAVMNPLGGGVISQNPKRFSFIKAHENQTISQAAISFVAAHQSVSVVLSGFTRIEQLKENLPCFHSDLKPANSNIDVIKKKLESAFDQLCTGCNYCALCRQGIRVNKLMLSYNQYMLSDYNKLELKEHLKVAWDYDYGQMFDCIGCGDCENVCTQHLPIIQRISEINAVCKEFKEEGEAFDRCLEFIFDKAGQHRIGIYPAGKLASGILGHHERKNKEVGSNIFFFESNPDRWGSSFFKSNLYINPPDTILELGITRMFIASEKHHDSIYKSIAYLEQHGIEIIGYKDILKDR